MTLPSRLSVINQLETLRKLVEAGTATAASFQQVRNVIIDFHATEEGGTRLVTWVLVDIENAEFYYCRAADYTQPTRRQFALGEIDEAIGFSRQLEETA